MADTNILGDWVARDLDALVRLYGKPQSIVTDNGTEFTSRAILKRAGKNSADWHDTDPGKPQQDAHIESFNGSLRAALLNKDTFDHLNDAKRKLGRWRHNDTHVRPHSSLGTQAPAQAGWMLEPTAGSAPGVLAQPGHEDYEVPTHRHAL